MTCKHSYRVVLGKYGEVQVLCRLCDEPLVAPARNKYNNRKGETSASALEARRHMELLQSEKMGIIAELRTQVSFEVVPKQEGERAVSYIADFVYMDVATRKLVVEDAKGFATKDYIIKRKLMLLKFGIRIYEFGRRKTNGKSNRRKTG
jgi:hypothetical protein